MDSLEPIKQKIYEIRGQRVMLDFDLAAMYDVETRALNQAVKRNIERFPEDFMFKLTKGEWTILKSRIVTTNATENQEDNGLTSQIVILKSGGNFFLFPNLFLKILLLCKLICIFASFYTNP